MNDKEKEFKEEDIGQLDFAMNILQEVMIHHNQENNPEILTGEKNIVISEKDLREKIRKLDKGEEYIKIITVEVSSLYRQNLLRAMEERGMFNIPDWDKFISAVNAFSSVCGPY